MRRDERGRGGGRQMAGIILVGNLISCLVEKIKDVKSSRKALC